MFPLSISTFPFSRKLFISAGVLLVALVLAGLFVYEVYAQPLPRTHTASAVAATPAGTVYLSPEARAAAQAGAAVKEPTREVHIANNGLILLRGARVLSISDNTIHVGMTLGASDFTWAAVTKYNSSFWKPDGTKGSISDINVGDIVTITGTLTGSGTEPAIDTEYVRE